MATVVLPRRANPIVARRRYVRQTGYLLLAIALAIIGQGFIANRDNRNEWPAIVLLGAGVLLTFLVDGRLEAESPLDKEPDPAGDVALGWRWPEVLKSPRVQVAAFVAVVSLAASLILFERAEGTTLNLAWLLYLVAMAVGVFAAFQLDPRQATLGRGWSRRDSYALGAILVLAAAFRLIQPDVPWGLWFDEAAHGLDVEHLLADPTFRPIYLETTVPEPALHWYFDAIFFALFGPSVFSLRISAALAGLVCVTAIFFLGRLLYGWRTGIVAGAFLAVAVWNVNFSRIMFNAIWSVALNALAGYFLAKGLSTRRFRDFALGGFFLGLGLNNYYTSRLFIIVAAIYLVYRWALEPRTFLQRSLAGIVVFGAFAFLSGGPLIEFALLHPDEFNARLAQVSVFGEVADQHSIEPLTSNIQKHLLMFNYAGDPNGRHNLSGSPELDQVMAALFVLGLALSLRRVRQEEYGLPLIWLPVVLAGGIFSLSFEAPQSLRSIDNSLVSVLFAAIPVGALWGRLSWLRLGTVSVPQYLGKAPVLTAGGVIALGLIAWTTSLDYQRYFVQQANDFRSWAEFSAAQSEAGREIGALDLSKTDVYLGAEFLGQPTIQFFAPAYHEQMFDATQDLPFHTARDVAIFLPDTDQQTIVTIERFYPQAVVRAFGPPFGGPTVLYSVRISANDIAALQGVNATFTPSTGGTGAAQSSRDASIDYDWTKTPPPAALPFNAVWQGVLTAPRFGDYVVKMQGPETSELFIDETSVAKGTKEQTVTLATGTHTLRMTAAIDQPRQVQLLWRPPSTALLTPIPHEDLFVPPVTSRGLLGQYYAGGGWQGAPVLEQIDASLDLHFHITPIPRPYSVQWDGKIDIPTSGVYTFGTQSIDSSSIYIDGQLIATNESQPNTYVQGAARLTDGLHDIRIKYQDLTGFSYITVSWQPPGLPREILPADRLFPPQGAYPERAGPLKPSTPRVIQTTTTPAPTGVLPRPSGPAPAAPQPAPPQPAEGPAAVGTLPVSPLRQIATIGQAGTDPGQLKGSRGITRDADGNVYVVSTDNFRVDKFGSDGKYLLSFGSQGDGQDQFKEPVDVAIDAAGQVLVLDSETAWIKAFGPDGKYVAEFGGPALAAYHPRALVVAVTGEIYLADAGGSRVVKLKPTGGLDRSLGDKGTDPGQLSEPVGIAVAPDGSIYVADTGTSRLSHFDAQFHLINSWGLPKAASVTGPRVLVAADGTLYVSDPEGKRVIHFDADGKGIDQVGGNGELQRPMGLAADSKGDLFVADDDRNKVVEFGPK